MEAELEDVAIVPFSEAWMDGVLDLMESHGVTDPLYGSTVARDERRARIAAKISSGLWRASVVAVGGGRVVGIAYAAVPPLCGETEKNMAWLSVTISLDRVGQAIGVRLVDRVCAEVKAQGIDLVRIGMLDSWGDWCDFLRKCGFEPNEGERTADAVLPQEARIPDALPETREIVRPIRLPEERGRVIDFSKREMEEGLPDSCAPEVGGKAWWEHWPDFDSRGFLVAEEPRTGEVVGYVCPVVVRDDRGARGIIDGMDVAKGLAATRLRERLLLQAVKWIRDRGVADIRYRVHIGYKDEQEVFERLGFRMENAAAVWYRPTS